jgi:flagellar basal-body rod modification protein FlgD
MEISNATTPSQAINEQTTKNAGNKFNQDFNSFLKLLTAQLKNQDPTEPMDSTQFVTQLTQLSQVEQSIKSNQNLESIISKIDATSRKSDINLLGKEIDIKSNRFLFNGEDAEFKFKLEDNVDEITIYIKNKDGDTVKTLTDVPKTAEEQHVIQWNGMNNSGNQSNFETYNIEISAKKNDGTIVNSETFVKAKINEVNLEGIDSKLVLNNGQKISTDDILNVRI